MKHKYLSPEEYLDFNSRCGEGILHCLKRHRHTDMCEVACMRLLDHKGEHIAEWGAAADADGYCHACGVRLNQPCAKKCFSTRKRTKP